jgi:hypothetical protein
MEPRSRSGIERRDWLVWVAVVLIGSIALPLALKEMWVAVSALALLAATALLRLWWRRRAGRSSASMP